MCGKTEFLAANAPLVGQRHSAHARAGCIETEPMSGHLVEIWPAVVKIRRIDHRRGVEGIVAPNRVHCPPVAAIDGGRAAPLSSRRYREREIDRVFDVTYVDRVQGERRRPQWVVNADHVHQFIDPVGVAIVQHEPCAHPSGGVSEHMGRLHIAKLHTNRRAKPHRKVYAGVAGGVVHRDRG